MSLGELKIREDKYVGRKLPCLILLFVLSPCSVYIFTLYLVTICWAISFPDCLINDDFFIL